MIDLPRSAWLFPRGTWMSQLKDGAQIWSQLPRWCIGIAISRRETFDGGAFMHGAMAHQNFSALFRRCPALWRSELTPSGTALASSGGMLTKEARSSKGHIFPTTENNTYGYNHFCYSDRNRSTVYEFRGSLQTIQSRDFAIKSEPDPSNPPSIDYTEPQDVDRLHSKHRKHGRKAQAPQNG